MSLGVAMIIILLCAFSLSEFILFVEDIVQGYYTRAGYHLFAWIGITSIMVWLGVK